MLKRVRNLGVGCSLLGVAMSAAVACDDPFAECKPGLDCPGDGNSPGHSGGSSPGGDNSGGATSPAGGSRAGGAGNSGGSTHTGGRPAGGAPSGGMAGEGSGGAAPEPCDGKCTGDTPFCDEKADECVGCLKQADCKDPTMPMCSLDWVCVPCLNDSSCTDTLGLPKPVVCLNGTEDKLTGERRPDTGECKECGRSSDCGGDICDLEAEGGPMCLDGLKFRAKGVCVSCEHDLECLEGHYCVPQKFGGKDIGNFCMETKLSRVGATGNCDDEGGSGRPFVDSVSLMSVGGQSDTFCVLRTTSCVGYNDHSEPVTGCTDESPASDLTCGAEGADDGLCRKKEGSTNVYCTYKCIKDVDCLIRGTQFDCVDTVEPAYCGLSGL